jgi:hypothetical protein
MGETATADAVVYSELADVDVQWLRTAATQLRASFRRTVSDVLSSGKLLAMARRRLGRDKWRPWLQNEAQIPTRSASRLVAVGQVFGTLPPASFKNFTPTALYTLAEPGVPQSIREYAVLQAKDGEEVTAGKVQEWLTLQRDTTLPAKKSEMKELLKLAPEDDAEPADEFYDPAEVFARENWRLVCEMTGPGCALHLDCTQDTENGDLTFSGVRIDATGGRVCATAGTVEAVVLKLSGGERRKTCAKCGENKLLEQFCRRTDLPDGREYRCKRCEADRVKAYAARKEKERSLARTTAG